VARSAAPAVSVARDNMNPELLLALGAALRRDARRSTVTRVASVLPAWLQSERKAA